MKRAGVVFVLVTLLSAGLMYVQGRTTHHPKRTVAEPRADSCISSRSALVKFVARRQDGQGFHEIPVWQLPRSKAFFFVSGMTIDADGAPNAYAPDNGGLDELANAGGPTHWDGIVTDRDGNPLIQGESDPFPGYYVSCTSLFDKTKPRTEPDRYVDASRMPYIALPRETADRGGARLGDFALVMNLQNGKFSYAIYADIGTLGEGSVALADNLGISSDARDGGESDGVLYLVFPASGNLQPRPLSEIQTEGKRLFEEWGGIDKLTSCAQIGDPNACESACNTGSGPASHGRPEDYASLD